MSTCGPADIITSVYLDDDTIHNNYMEHSVTHLKLAQNTFYLHFII